MGGWATVMTFVWIGLALVVFGLLVGFLFVGRSQRGSAPQAPPRPTPTAPPTTREPGVGDDAEPPRDTPTRTIDEVVLPDDATAGGDTAVLELETPDPVAGRLQRLRARLARSQSTLGKGLLSLLSRDRLDDATWEEIEDTLLAADVGVAPTQELVERLRTRVRIESASGAQAQALLREELIALVDPSYDRTLHADRVDGKPAVVMVVGVNGVGKTTTVGKIARVLVAQ